MTDRRRSSATFHRTVIPPPGSATTWPQPAQCVKSGRSASGDCTRHPHHASCSTRGMTGQTVVALWVLALRWAVRRCALDCRSQSGQQTQRLGGGQVLRDRPADGDRDRLEVRAPAVMAVLELAELEVV